MCAGSPLRLMPKPKPDQVIRHEIVLSRPLQDTVDGLVGSKQFNNIASPIITAVNDNTTLILLLGTIASLGLTGVAFAYLPPKLDEAIDITGQFVGAESIVQIKGGSTKPIVRSYKKKNVLYTLINSQHS